MRRKAIPILVLGAGLVAAVDAGAQTTGNATVLANITFDKTLNVVENIGREKAVFINVTPMLMTNGMAETAAVAVVGNRDGRYENVPGGGDGGPILRNVIEARLTNAITLNSGVIHVNQDVGTMSNQANLLAIGQTFVGGLADSQAEAEQYHLNNILILTGITTPPDQPGQLPTFSVQRKAVLGDAVSFNISNISVNQNAGELNNQTNAAAVSAAHDGTVQLGEAALGQTTASNNAQRAGTQHAATINNAVNTNLAQLNVNQAAGAMTSQSSTFNFSATFSFGVNEATIPPATYRQFQ